MLQIRRCEIFTIHQASEVANLDPERFRNLSVPYEGETDKEFLEYLHNRYDLEEIWDEIDSESQNELTKLWEPDWREYYNSAWKYEESWYESGKVNDVWTKTGGFEVMDSTAQF